MTMQRHFRILALVLLTLLAPLGNTAAAPVSEDATPAARVDQSIRAYICDTDPGQILQTEPTPSCNSAGAGIRFTCSDQ